MRRPARLSLSTSDRLGIQCAPAASDWRLVQGDDAATRAAQGGSDLMSLQADLAAPSAPPTAQPASVPNPPSLPSPRHPAWADVPESSWNDVGWQLKHAIRSAADLSRFLDLGEVERRATDELGRVFSFAVTPYYFSLIDPSDPDDPIRRMILPSLAEERSTASGEVDPLGEKSDQVAPGLTHRYPDRVLFVVTSFCTSYCRFCIRKRNWHGSDAARSRADIDQALAYIGSHREIRDVLVSGGDPLTLPPKQLDYALAGLRRIPHVEIVRLGSREPVQLPMRITPDLVGLLERHGPVWVNTHFNHPREITADAARAVDRLLRAGIPVNNQSVLLRGVNDSVEVMRELLHGLLRIKVRPYYLYHCDDVVGAAHLRTSVRRGLEILEGLRGHTTGFAIPTFVVDAPGGGGKIPLTPNYLVSQGENSLVVRNFEGVLVRIDDAPAAPPADTRLERAPARKNGGRAARASSPPQSVADLLAGDGRRLVPQGLQHYARRRAVAGASRARRRRSEKPLP
jgi:lysine 2,3-aminomutase